MIDGGRLLLGLAGCTGLATILGAVLPVPAKAAEPISVEEAHAIGVEAYLYFYPLVTMDLTRRQLTNGGAPASPVHGPTNEFHSLPAYPSADVKVVVAPARAQPISWSDSSGQSLDGANAYSIHFDKGATPPAEAFWSITLYDAHGYQVANSLDRFALSSWMPLKHNSDGSFDLYFQNESPGQEKEANWLPAPKGSFNLTMRLYAPKSEALTGKWNPPPVVKNEGVAHALPQ